eukprot:gene23152-biopygen11803
MCMRPRQPVQAMCMRAAPTACAGHVHADFPLADCASYPTMSPGDGPLVPIGTIRTLIRIYSELSTLTVLRRTGHVFVPIRCRFKCVCSHLGFPAGCILSSPSTEICLRSLGLSHLCATEDVELVLASWFRWG